MVALFCAGNRDDAAKAMDEFSTNFIPDLSPTKQFLTSSPAVEKRYASVGLPLSLEEIEIRDENNY